MVICFQHPPAMMNRCTARIVLPQHVVALTQKGNKGHVVRYLFNTYIIWLISILHTRKLSKGTDCVKLSTLQSTLSAVEVDKRKILLIALKKAFEVWCLVLQGEGDDGLQICELYCRRRNERHHDNQSTAVRSGLDLGFVRRTFNNQRISLSRQNSPSTSHHSRPNYSCKHLQTPCQVAISVQNLTPTR